MLKTKYFGASGEKSFVERTFQWGAVLILVSASVLATVALIRLELFATPVRLKKGWSFSRSARPQATLEIVSGAPFSGEVVSQTVQPDGARVSDKTESVKIWRDSQGRVRTERPFNFLKMGGPLEVRDAQDRIRTERPIDFTNVNASEAVEIVDPVAHCRYYLDEVEHIAHRVTLTRTFAAEATTPPPETPNLDPRAGRDAVALGSKVEPLADRLIESVPAAGIRQTTSYAVGGNNKPAFSTTFDTWTSQELHLTLLSVFSRPQVGVTTTEVRNLSRAEPDPELFRVPAGYRVVEERGEFAIHQRVQ